MQYLIAFSFSFVLSLIFIPHVRTVARRNGYLAYPQENRWHKKPTALLGGIGIFAAFLAVYFILPLRGTHQDFMIVSISCVLFFIGLTDDLRGLSPFWKLAVQIISGIVLCQSGLVFPLTSWHSVNCFLTVFWFTGITNAFNLLDNIAGMCSDLISGSPNETV